MQAKAKGVIVSAIAGVTAFAVATGVIAGMSPKVSADKVVDFSTGTYDVWNGVDYDFSWYTAGAPYTISSASQLAALSILTNDLSHGQGGEWDTIIANVKTSVGDDTVADTYIAMCEDFSGEEIKLTANIDLDGKDWLPISYPWNTANLSSSYEFTNVNGDTVKYNAVDYIPDEVVDPWVGDENGKPISTRYWEYPESEMRFRDLVQPLSVTSTNNGDVVDFKSRFYPRIQLENVGSMGYVLGIKSSVHVSTSIPVLEHEAYDYYTEIVKPCQYKDITGFTSSKGFAGTFDAQESKVKGVHPATPWTTDPLERLTTYDPLGKGLFGLIAEDGVVKNLNIKGAYTDDIVSYGALFCAYNYGTIDNCYVEGDMSQALIDMVYPVAREYKSNKQSNYYLSNAANADGITDIPEHGTVMPVGNCGFMTAVNYGTVKNSKTVGSVTQAFRQFGFFAAVNYGTIDNCKNTADLASTAITTDFITDEWDWDSTRHTHKVSSTLVANLPVASGMPYEYLKTNAYMIDDVRYVFNQLTLGTATGRSNGVVDEINTKDEYLWIAGLYNTDEGESIAANHLYGVYQLTLAGGIAAVNDGVITGCENTGNIQTLDNVSPRNGFNTYDNGDIDHKDYYSYIRPSNAYGIFATAYDTNSIAGGIAALNTGDISDTTNSGTITKRNLRANEFSGLDGSGFGETHGFYEPSARSKYMDFIPVTENLFYQNDVLSDTTDISSASAYGFQWWVTDTNWSGKTEESSSLPSVPFTPTVDRNMPYPYHFDMDCYSTVLTAGIAANNTGKIDNCKNLAAANAEAGIVNVSVGINEVAEITNCQQLSADCYLANICNVAVDTNISDCVVDGSVQNYADAGVTDESLYRNDNYGISEIAGLVNTFIQKQYDVAVKDSVINRGIGAFVTIEGNTSKPEISNIVVADTNTYETMSTLNGKTVGYRGFARDIINATLSEIYNLQKYSNNKGEGFAHTVKNSDVSDVYSYPNVINCGFAEVVDNSKLNNINIFPTASKYAFSKATNDSELTDINVYCFTDADTLGKADNGIGAYDKTSLTNVRVFTNFKNQLMTMGECTVDDMILYGDSDIIVTNSKNPGYTDYVFYVDQTTAKNMVVQADVDFTFRNYPNNIVIQDIPGILKSPVDSNKFDTCAIQVPDGMISYPTRNIYNADIPDNVRGGISMAYDENARASGALAYYLDGGNTGSRTKEWTVAKTDTKVITEGVPGSVDTSSLTFTTLNLPAYTRMKKDAAETSYYQLNIPYNSLGAGEIIGTVTHADSTSYSTKVEGEIFPKTSLFVEEGERVNLNIVEHEGYELIGMYRNTTELSEKIESDLMHGDKFVHNYEIMPDCDISLEGVWSGVYSIEIDDSINDWVEIVPNAYGAAMGREVRLCAQIKDSNYAIGSVYYCMYTVDGSNRIVLDYTNPVEISLKEMAFEMPAANIKIFATPSTTDCSITEFIVAGAEGRINEISGTIEVALNSSVDLTSIVPDRITIAENATISPSATTAVDLTSPVTYTVTSQSGDTKTYTVSVIPKEDGKITKFELAGTYANIDQDTGTINIRVSATADITNAVPYIVWDGASITPDPTTAQNFDTTVTYTVTASDSSVKTYTVVVTRSDGSQALSVIAFKVNGVDYNGVINNVTRKITVEIPYGYDLDAVPVSDLGWYGRAINVTLGETMNLTAANNITVVDDAGASIVYSLIVKEIPHYRKVISQFILFGYEGIIDESAKTITVNIPTRYDITDIAPDLITFSGKTITDRGTRHNFTSGSPITYTVTAYDDTTATYTVIVNQI